MNDPDTDQTPVGARLLGASCSDLGAVGVREVGGHVAIALSRGRYPKGYPAVAENEDAVLGLVRGERWLLAVADGHNGREASEAAIRGIDAEASALLDRKPSLAVAEAFAVAMRAVRGALAEVGDPRSGSATALSVAVGNEGVACHAGVGDTACLIARRTRTRMFVGVDGFIDARSRPAPSVRRVAVRTGTAVVLATDGLTDFLGPGGPRLVRGALRGRPADDARRLVGLAFDGGAGDNIAVALWKSRPSSAGGRPSQ